MQVEHLIRDWLVLNPEFIEKGLEVIEKEHHLPDDIGTSGFIDILCKDIYNNFVIIEIKRSDSAARQTFTEIFKYAELIRTKYRARYSEIRMIVISTHWREIIRAFSLTVFRSPFAIKGLKIFLDDQTKVPKSVEEVVPIEETSFSRKFMEQQIIYLFTSERKMEDARQVLERKLNVSHVYNYVIVILNATEANRPITYPYAMNVAFQIQAKDESLLCIERLGGKRHLDMEEEEFDSEEEYQEYLNDVFMAALEMEKHCDSVEAGCGEKFEATETGKVWKISSIKRYGTFSIDPRYSDELLLKELKGHDGRSSNKFTGFCESSQKERFNEIKSECQYCLRQTPFWAEIIDHILSKLQQKKEKFRLIVDIYNPDSIASAFYFALTNETKNYLPLFHIFVDYIDSDKTEIYIGEIYSLGTSPEFKMFTPMNDNEIFQEIFSFNFMPDNEVTAFRMGLHYGVLCSQIINGIESPQQFIELDDGEIKLSDARYYSIEDYLAENISSLRQMISNYNRVYYKV